eukprot:g16656.t1
MARLLCLAILAGVAGAGGAKFNEDAAVPELAKKRLVQLEAKAELAQLREQVALAEEEEFEVQEMLAANGGMRLQTSQEHVASLEQKLRDLSGGSSVGVSFLQTASDSLRATQAKLVEEQDRAEVDGLLLRQKRREVALAKAKLEMLQVLQKKMEATGYKREELLVETHRMMDTPMFEGSSMPTTVDAMVELPYLEEWWDGPFDKVQRSDHQRLEQLTAAEGTRLQQAQQRQAEGQLRLQRLQQERQRLEASVQRSKQLGHSDATYAALEEKRRTQAALEAKEKEVAATEAEVAKAKEEISLQKATLKQVQDSASVLREESNKENSKIQQVQKQETRRRLLIIHFSSPVHSPRKQTQRIMEHAQKQLEEEEQLAEAEASEAEEELAEAKIEEESESKEKTATAKQRDRAKDHDLFLTIQTQASKIGIDALTEVTELQQKLVHERDAKKKRVTEHQYEVKRMQNRYLKLRRQAEEKLKKMDLELERSKAEMPEEQQHLQEVQTQLARVKERLAKAKETLAEEKATTQRRLEDVRNAAKQKESDQAAKLRQMKDRSPTKVRHFISEHGRALLEEQDDKEARQWKEKVEAVKAAKQRDIQSAEVQKEELKLKQLQEEHSARKAEAQAYLAKEMKAAELATSKVQAMHLESKEKQKVEEAVLTWRSAHQSTLARVGLVS